MISLKNLSIGYGKKIILDNLNLNLDKGELVSILGVNGSGKSTLIKTIVGLNQPLGGEIIIDGVNQKDLTSRDRAKKISYLSQSRNTPEITARKMVLHGRFPYLGYPRKYTDEDEEIADEALKAVGAYELRNRSVTTLSGGERQRVYLAMALAQQTDYVLMDEPTTYLDIKYQLEMTKLSQKLAKEGKCVVSVTHDLHLALKFSDRIIMFKDKKIFFDGKPDLVTDEMIEECFFN